MSKRGFLNQILVVLLILATLGCNKEFKKAYNSDDWKVKYDAAMNFYEAKDYYKSITLLEQILPIIRGTEEAEKANFIYAYAYFNDKQYITSAHLFRQFYTVYGRSKYALEAEYMYAFSLYQQSPIFTLDQAPTNEAVAAMQTFLNKYPYSEYTEKANKMIDELQVKLERKAVFNAKEYHKLRRYKSAQIAFRNFGKDYPDSKYTEEIAFLELEATYELARQSILAKQKERYNDTIKLYLAYIDKYGDSQYLKQAETYYSNSLQALRNLNVISKQIN